ncbi:MAG TPA: hypothetical protein VLA32_05575 [Anaerolineales bacterium]|nr:hypothetical protein [Anaerolineales bacterium]
MQEMSCGVIYVIVAVIFGFYWGFRDEINDLWQDIFGKRIDATPEKDRFEFRSWWGDQLSDDERESFLKIVQDPLGADSDPQDPGNDDPESLDPD